MSRGVRAVVVAFSKYDPYRPEPEANGLDATTPEGARRALILKWAWLVSAAYTTMGFGFIVYWLMT